MVDYTKQTVDQVYKNNPFDAVIDQIGGMSPESHICLHVVLPAVSLAGLEGKATGQLVLPMPCSQALPDSLPRCAGPTTSQSLAVLKKNGHISFVLNENINYFKLTAG